ncbi:cholecystokinin receptor-like isoform X2 [Rhodnius prolixus]|uniref:cholecystokinin receptor-like isoform X2 n=1 Tax=Rhodnius prolixus TaxID=13249 RepID=UPI003D188B5C
MFHMIKMLPTESWWEAGKVQIPTYSIIFLLGLVGNILVILVLVKNKGMRTVTNVFLLNLAVSDILLGVLCMPFTLVGSLLKDFVFGHFMCRLIPYMQACSVAVSGWTLVCLSVERYYAICHPLRSRTWQTLTHAYRLIGAIWVCSLLLMTPISVLSELIPTSGGHRKCRELWPNEDIEKTYNLLLDFLLLVIPLIVMVTTYTLVAKTLWRVMKTQKPGNKMGLKDNRVTWKQNSRGSPHLRRSNTEKALKKKKRVVKMLFAVVLEFFVCWTPLYVINTITLFAPQAVYERLGYKGISFLQLLAYSSSCCNPITYCFMNSSFRRAFLKLFGCLREEKGSS